MWVRIGAYPRAGYVKDVPLMPSTVNIRLGWKGMPGTNTLAHYENS
jgi:hypothetical protein